MLDAETLALESICDQVWIKLAIKGYWGRCSHKSCGARLKALVISRSAAASVFTDTQIGIAPKLSRRDVLEHFEANFRLNLWGK